MFKVRYIEETTPWLKKHHIYTVVYEDEEYYYLNDKNGINGLRQTRSSRWLKTRFEKITRKKKLERVLKCLK